MKKTILFLGLLGLSACSSGSGDPSKSQATFDPTSVSSELGRRLLAHDWCDKYYDAEIEGKEIFERIRYREDSTARLEFRFRTEGGQEGQDPSLTIRWSVRGRDTLQMSAQGQRIEARIEFGEREGKECYFLKDLRRDGVAVPETENSAPAFKCACD